MKYFIADTGKTAMKRKKYSYNKAFACFECRKSFKRKVEFMNDPRNLVCQHCGGIAINLGRYFKPPKRNNIKQWHKVQFLVEHGFRFQKIGVYEPDNSHAIGSIPYPKTLEQAKEFVKNYKPHARYLKI